MIRATDPDERATIRRQFELAKLIGREFCGTPKLKALGRHSSFAPAPGVMQIWLQQPDV